MVSFIEAEVVSSQSFLEQRATLAHAPVRYILVDCISWRTPGVQGILPLYYTEQSLSLYYETHTFPKSMVNMLRASWL